MVFEITVLVQNRIPSSWWTIYSLNTIQESGTQYSDNVMNFNWLHNKNYFIPLVQNFIFKWYTVAGHWACRTLNKALLILRQPATETIAIDCCTWRRSNGNCVPWARTFWRWVTRQLAHLRTSPLNHLLHFLLPHTFICYPTRLPTRFLSCFLATLLASSQSYSLSYSVPHTFISLPYSLPRRLAS
jgi:hypothetical protein